MHSLAYSTHQSCQFGINLAFERKGLVIDDVPMKDVELVVSHGILTRERERERETVRRIRQPKWLRLTKLSKRTLSGTK